MAQREQTLREVADDGTRVGKEFQALHNSPTHERHDSDTDGGYDIARDSELTQETTKTDTRTLEEGAEHRDLQQERDNGQQCYEEHIHYTLCDNGADTAAEVATIIAAEHAAT